LDKHVKIGSKQKQEEPASSSRVSVWGFPVAVGRELGVEGLEDRVSPDGIAGFLSIVGDVIIFPF
jgi:hypothetical protein